MTRREVGAVPMTRLRLEVDTLGCGAPASEVEETLQARTDVAGASVDLREEVVEVELRDGDPDPDLVDVLDFFGLQVRGGDLDGLAGPPEAGN